MKSPVGLKKGCFSFFLSSIFALDCRWWSSSMGRAACAPKANKARRAKLNILVVMFLASAVLPGVLISTKGRFAEVVSVRRG